MARVTLRRAVQMDSTSIDALTAYGDYCMRHNDIEEYCSTVRLLMAQPDYPTQTKSEICQTLTSDRQFYGENYVAVGRVLGAFVMHHPTDKRAIDLYGDHLLAGGEVEAALDFFKLHLDMEPPVMDYYMAVIDLEEYLQHPDSVDYYVQRAMQRFPDSPTLHIRKANRLYIKGDLQGAVDSFKSSLAMAQNDTLRGQIWGYIGDTYHAMAERRAALEKVGIKRDTSAYPIRISKKKAQALCYESYENSLALYQDNAMTLNNYAYYLSVEGLQLERALVMSTKAISLASSNATYLDTHAWVLYKLGRYAEARNVMRKALMLDTEADPTLMMHYGDILYALEEFYMAETYWQKALDNGADSDEVEQRLQLLKNKDK
jgi:tetratricopeptide (TPR) repeat protein